jgi:hypothetical protein
LLFY